MDTIDFNHTTEEFDCNGPPIGVFALPLRFEHVQLIPSLSQDMGHMGALGTLHSQFHLGLTTRCLQNLVQYQFPSSSFMIHVHSLLPCKFPFWGDSIARGVLGSPFHQITSQKSRLEAVGGLIRSSWISRAQKSGKALVLL